MDMRRCGLALALVLACAVVPGRAHAQLEGGPVLGLPIVVKEGGWARYLTQTEEGEPAELVIQVGAPGSYKGRRGRWLQLQVHMPEVGRITVEFLVVGGFFGPRNLALARVRMPGQPMRESAPEAQAEELPAPRMIGKSTERLAGKLLPITQYAFQRGTTASWSPLVPGVGLTRVTGAQPLRLLAFGVGGDPWKDAQPLP
jgi:hypothetical protein